MEVREMSKKLRNVLPAEERDKLVKQKRKEDEKMVTGYFEFIDAQGGWFEFSNRIWPGETIKIIKLIHGEKCDLPLGIVRLLNNTVKKVRNYDLSIPWDGKKPPRSYTTVSRVRFTPVEMYG